MREITQYHLPKTSKETIFDPEELGVGNSALEYANKFPTKHSGNNYGSHITLRLLKPPEIDLPITCKATLGVYQLGDGCQCRRKLS